MTQDLKELSGETQRIADSVLMEQALSAPRLKKENDTLLLFVELVALHFEGTDSPLGTRARALLKVLKP